MKIKSIFALSLLSLTFAACSSDDVISNEGAENAILFGATEEAGSRGAGTDLTALQTNGFKVYANSKTSSTPTVNPIMDGQLVTYNSSEWTYNPLKFWPAEEGATVDFYARYEGTAADAENILPVYDWNSIPQVTFRVNNDVMKQTDYLWAAPSLNTVRTSSPVTFNFKHALAAFVFNLAFTGSNVDYDASTMCIQVNSVAIKGEFPTVGKIKPNETDLAKIWDLSSSPFVEKTFKLSADKTGEFAMTEPYFEVGAASTKLSGDDATMFLLPFTSINYYIELDITVVEYSDVASKTGHIPSQIVRSKDVKLSKLVAGANVEAGKKYDVNLAVDITTMDLSYSIVPTSISTEDFQMTTTPWY